MIGAVCLWQRDIALHVKTQYVEEGLAELK